MLKFSQKSLLVAALLLAAFCACGISARADNGRGRHKKIYAVPVPGKVVIDGNLDDWDLSGQLLMYVISDTADTQSAKFALMFDSDALYVSGDVRDPHPLMNRHDPLVDPDKGWDGDACQLRLVVDPKQGYPVKLAAFQKTPDPQMIHMTMWYYTDRKEPVLQYATGMDYAPPIAGWKGGIVPNDLYQAAYKLAPDGRGYTFEYRIPWSVIQATDPPKGGDLLTGTVQFDWAQADGLHTAGGGAWAYDVMGEPGFAFQSSACWGKVIFSPTGHIPRSMVEEGLPPDKPEPLTFSYNLPADGDVTLQLFKADGTEVRMLAASAPRHAGKNVEHWDGAGDDGKPLQPGEYVWRGLYHQPLKTKFILSAHNSGQPPYKTDDGTGGWGGDHGAVTSVCAAPGGVLMAWSVSESGWGIIRTDLNGKKQWGSRHNAQDLATDGHVLFASGDFGYDYANSVKVFSLQDGRPLNFGDGAPALAPPPGGSPETDIASGVAYRAGKLYVSWAKRDMVGVYDSASGNLLDTWPIPAPRRITALADGRVLVISNGAVGVATKAGLQPLALSKIDSPTGLASDASGHIYVANAGVLQDITVFDASGQYVKTIGKVGGRPRVGLYDSSGILEPGGISVDETGKLWVAETLDGPKRVSAWNTDTGALAGEYFGASAYFGWAYMDPRHPDELYCHNVLWKVNLTTGTCKPYSTIWRATSANMVSEANPGGYAGHFRVITASNGHQYGWGMENYANMLYERVGDIFKPICGILRVARGNAYGNDAMPAMADPAKYPNGAYFWQDKNDDQTVQTDEITPLTQRSESAFNWIDKDLNVWCDAGYVLHPVKVDADGRPWYDFSQKQPITLTGSNANGTSMVIDSTDGSIYRLGPGDNPGWAHYTADGKPLWAYPQITPWQSALNLPVVTPGKLWGLTMPLGIAGDFTGAACYYGPYHIFTRDGLYVGMVMRDGRTGGLGADITASEVCTGQLVKPDGMDRYFLLAGDQDGRVTEILGLDTVKRLKGGALTLSASDASTAAIALAAYQTEMAKTHRLEIVRGKAALESAPTVGKALDDSRSFSAAAAYDDKNLYVRYEVTAPTDLTNSYTDPQRLFKGGNALDIQIATDPNADPKRTRPAAGDVRLLITRQNGKTVAVLYRPVVSSFAGEPIVLTSPTGRESFDVISTGVPVDLEYARTPLGFRAIATIPLDVLGLSLKPGGAVHMDMGYLFGNDTGNVIAARAYWSNNGPDAGITNDVPSESRLTPKEWGDAVVE